MDVYGQFVLPKPWNIYPICSVFTKPVTSSSKRSSNLNSDRIAYVRHNFASSLVSFLTKQCSAFYKPRLVRVIVTDMGTKPCYEMRNEKCA